MKITTSNLTAHVNTSKTRTITNPNREENLIGGQKADRRLLICPVEAILFALNDIVYISPAFTRKEVPSGIYH